MNVVRPQHKPKGDQDLSLKDFQAIAVLALREFGLSLPDSKRQLVQSRLARRVRVLQLSSFAEYRRLLESSAGREERSHLLSALTTNVTKFFREIHHFETLLETIMPQLVVRARRGERVRIWSAGCSSGQEPYSIAMTALKCDAGIASTNFKILATDIDPKIIEQARTAIYRDEEISEIAPQYYRSTDIIRNPNGKPDHFSPSNEVRSLVTFGLLNLTRDLPFSGAFDVIFCRNVAIYFDNSTQQLVWSRFARLLPKDGKLIIGHSERIRTHDCPNLTPDGITVYRKI